MFGKIVKSQYVGKSKIDFTFNGNPVNKKTLIGDIGLPFTDKDGVPFVNRNQYLPDYFIIGDVSDISTMELIPNKVCDTKVLYITGIPKNAKTLEPFTLKNVLWSSYYEDKHRGYLFQMVNSNLGIELKTPTVDNIKINNKYECSTVHRTI